MKKFRLQPDELRIESFETGTDAPVRGTVLARDQQGHPFEIPSDLNTRTNAGYTCAATCRGTCLATCNVSCPESNCGSCAPCPPWPLPVTVAMETTIVEL